MTMRAVADHFSATPGAYSRYRPSYPEELFDYLAEEAPGRELAWDCATGGGQAAGPLAERFRRVIATDASVAQLSRRIERSGVHYAAGRAEAAPLATGSTDLIAVSQALHWFDFERFFAEVERVLTPGGLLAAWTYDLLRVDSEIDTVIDRFHYDVVEPYWPPERAYVDSRYETIPFPFERLAPPALEMSEEWDLGRLIGYLGTWSAVGRYRAARQTDPVSMFRRELERVWPDPERQREVTWKLTLLVGRTNRAVAEGGSDGRG